MARRLSARRRAHILVAQALDLGIAGPAVRLIAGGVEEERSHRSGMLSAPRR
jgi:hypothetical protein